ncbi:EamA family transporter RarD [Streptomyces nitrosporeus]|uniref:EamA family transporter RarD n=1 Tax=Streptomyces nitrosporeus TaxID=28894 RepID=A0A5J6F9C1_9ACTN|nr:EamA family transporter RarD [Streptomyces nitrosporeus]QEU72938.1 EamA family transporter RarD [Streptomyces nitrosporeus]GGZ13812.1 protein RarD [Streptomyces nitrosporeus]
MKGKNEQRAGLLYGIGAYGMWGLVPLFWPLLEPAGAVEILAHRMVWSLGVVVIALLALRRWAWVRELAGQPRRLALITVAAAVISVNWGLYIWSVNNGHVVEASLGYFINPLVTIAMGVLLLGERLRPAQWAAVATGFAAVLVLAIGYGQPPWISLVLAFSFATYGLAKKKVGMGGLESLAAETAVLFLPALGFLLWLGARGESTFGSGAGHAALLATTGLVTAIPLICFGAAAIRVPLSVLGLLQYLAPVFQFGLGVLYFHEEMPPERWAGFGLVWVALALLTWDALRAARRNRSEALRLAALAAGATPDDTAAPGDTAAPPDGTAAPGGTAALPDDTAAPGDTAAPSDDTAARRTEAPSG